MKETPDSLQYDIRSIRDKFNYTMIVITLVSSALAGVPPTETRNIRTKNIQPNPVKKSEKDTIKKTSKPKNPTSPKSTPAGVPLDSTADPHDPVLAGTSHKTIDNS